MKPWRCWSEDSTVGPGSGCYTHVVTHGAAGTVGSMGTHGGAVKVLDGRKAPWVRGWLDLPALDSCQRSEAPALGRRRLSIGDAGTHGAVRPVGVQGSDGGAVKVLVG